MSTAPLTQFAHRSVSGVSLSLGHPNYESVQNFTEDENVKIFQYNKDGTYFGWASSGRVVILNAGTTEILTEIARKNVVEIGFSPKGTYLSTWERPVKLEENTMHRNLIVWEVKSGKELISFTQKSQNNWNVQWTEDETMFCRMVNNEIQFYESKRVEKGVHSRLKLDGVSDYSLSPGKGPSIAVFVPEKKSGPARVQMYSITNFNSTLAQKTFYKADKIQMKWNELGTNLLVLTHTDVDKTGKSYYGETNLYFLSVAGSYDCRVALDKEGPIHDVAWSPNSKEFIVIYGFMPAKATLFDHRAEPVHDFGMNPRNVVQFNPQGRLIFIAGFGNLAGTMDIWDRKNFKKITTIEAPNSSESAWSPDGRFIITATLSPRLRVDNGYKIWHYTGVLVHAKNVNELLQVGWRPANVNLHPMRSSLSPPPPAAKNAEEFAVKPPSKASGAYRPPHARGQATPDHFKREDETSMKPLQQSNGIKGIEPLSKAAVKNKKKREAAKKKKDEGPLRSPENEEKQPAHPIPLPESTISNNGKPAANSIPVDVDSLALTSSSALTETEKKIRNLTKKLRQIAELKERQVHGEKLEQTQIQKIANEATLQKELNMLKAQ